MEHRALRNAASGEILAMERASKVVAERVRSPFNGMVSNAGGRDQQSRVETDRSGGASIIVNAG
jgi:hypothetical protein